MTLQDDSLELAIGLLLQGIFPRKPHTINYTEVIARIKKELKLVLSVKEIDQIILLIIQSMCDAQYQDSALRFINQAQAKTIVSNNKGLLKDFQNEINQNIGKNQANQAIEIIIEE